MITAQKMSAYGSLSSVSADILLSSRSYDFIDPTGQGYDERAKIEYGKAAIGDSSSEVQMLANGDIVFNKSGTYVVSFYFRYYRTGNSQVAKLVLWSLFDGVAAGDPLPVELASQNDRHAIEATIAIDVVSGTALSGEIMRDTGTGAANDGGLAPYIVNDTSGGTDGPNDGVSASVIVYKYES